MKRTAIVTCVILCVLACPLTAGEKAKGTKAAGDKVTVESVKGSAQYCVPAGGKEKWLPLKKGAELGEMTLLRTGFGANVVLHFKDDTRVTIHGAAKMGIKEFRKSKKVTTTKIGLKYGVIKARVDSTHNPNDFKVRVHNTTLAVTGSRGGVAAWIDSGLRFFGFGGWSVSNDKGSRNVSGGQTNQNLDPDSQIVGNNLNTGQGGNWQGAFGYLWQNFNGAIGTWGTHLRQFFFGSGKCSSMPSMPSMPSVIVPSIPMP